MLIDTRLAASHHFCDFLHGFRSGIGTGTAVMEMKLAQELDRVYRNPLFLVFIELRKSYDNVNRGHLIQTLEGYGVIPRLCGLLVTV